MSDMCKCGHKKNDHVIIRDDGCIATQFCPCKKYEEASETYHYISWAELRASNERMADVVSAALRFSEDLIESVDEDCDCATCNLKRATDKYTEVK